MNITSTEPTARPPQLLQSSFCCDRHPAEQFTGFCPSCLVERLNTLDASAITPNSFHRHSSASTATAALKFLFSATSRASNFLAPPSKPSKPVSFLPGLRRSTSSSSENEALGQSLEPYRESSDIRAKNTLGSLFSLDDETKTTASSPNWPIPAVSSSHQIPQISSAKPIESCIVNKPVSEENEIEEDFKDLPENLDDIVTPPDVDGNGDEIRPADDTHLQNPRNPVGINPDISDIVEEKVESLSHQKPMKDHTDLVAHAQAKKTSGGGFWAVAYVFNHKWRKWRHKQKAKNQNSGKTPAWLSVENPISCHYQETQSEIADYRFSRRSTDMDPRFSLDAPRISFDDPRYSFDDPRPSWDSFSTRRNFPKIPSMFSLPKPPNFINGDMPGGSVQTRDYYLDSSSSRRRKSLDRSSLIKKTATAVVAEIDELKMVSFNAKVLPTNSSRDDTSETIELSSVLTEGILGNAEKKETRKSKKWGWKIRGFLQRKSHKHEDDTYSKYSGTNGVDRSLSLSWQLSRTEGKNGLRSNSSVSWRHAGPFGPPFFNGRSDFAVDKNRNSSQGNVKPDNAYSVGRSAMRLY